jgi:hypothetical protein
MPDVMVVISKKWFYNKGREEEIDEMYELFDRRYWNRIQFQGQTASGAAGG